MDSKAKLFGHPIHPMLVAFPIAFYSSTVVAYAGYAVTGHTYYFHLGVVANVVGAVSAAVAAIPGFIDWAFGVPAGHPAKTTGLQHMLLNVAALGLFTADAILQLAKWDAIAPSGALAVGLAGAGMAATIGAGFLGWKLVGKHHVGVELSREQERLDFVRPANRSRP